MAPRVIYEASPYIGVRNFLRLVFSAAWIGYWYYHLDAQRAAEIAEHIRCKNSTGVAATSCAAGSFLWGDEGMANTNFDMNFVGLLVLTPLMFLPARFVGGRVLGFAGAYAELSEVRQQKAQVRTQQRQSQLRLAHGEAQAADESQRIRRSEVLLKLGSINDLLDVLAEETDQDRRMQIRLSVAQALRELAAKYELAALGALIKSDDVLRHTAMTVIERLASSPLSSITELHVIRMALAG